MLSVFFAVETLVVHGSPTVTGVVVGVETNRAQPVLVSLSQSFFPFFYGREGSASVIVVSSSTKNTGKASQKPGHVRG